ncbi:MAG TPA: hypothetical protein P5132_06610 [Bacteroidales bacterium]|nr:hypothetical protein [Bacteroidales bacterium]
MKKKIYLAFILTLGVFYLFSGIIKITNLESNDQLYMFSDGFQDQFGGNDEKKYLRSNFEKLLLSISDHSITVQKNIIDNTFQTWKGDHKQIDDVLVMGIKV